MTVYVPRHESARLEVVFLETFIAGNYQLLVTIYVKLLSQFLRALVLMMEKHSN